MTQTTVTVLSLGDNDGDTGLLFRIRDRIETSSILVFGGPLLGPGDDFAPGIFASVLYALKKLPVFLVSAGIFVIILIAHGGPWNNGDN
jgi:hypothetical protein